MPLPSRHSRNASRHSRTHSRHSRNTPTSYAPVVERPNATTITSFPHSLTSFPQHTHVTPALTYVIPAKAGIHRTASDAPSLARIRGELDLPYAVDAVVLPGGDSRDGVLWKVDAGYALAVE